MVRALGVFLARTRINTYPGGPESSTHQFRVRWRRAGPESGGRNPPARVKEVDNARTFTS